MRKKKLIAVLLAGTLAASQPLTSVIAAGADVEFSDMDISGQENIEQSSGLTSTEELDNTMSFSESADEETFDNSESTSLDSYATNDDENSTPKSYVETESDFSDGISTIPDLNIDTSINSMICHLMLSDGNKMNAELINSGNIHNDYKLDVREITGLQKQAEEENLNSQSVDGVKKISLLMFSLTIKDSQDNDFLFSESSTIKLMLSDMTFLKDSFLYHKKEDSSWEQIKYKQLQDEEGKNYIEFIAKDAVGEFTFVKNNSDDATSIRSPEPNGSLPIDGNTKSKDSYVTDEDLSVIKKTTDFTWDGGIFGQNLTVNVSGKTERPDTDVLQVTEPTGDTITTAKEAISKETNKKASDIFSVDLHLYDYAGEENKLDDVYTVNFHGLNIPENKILYHEIETNQWEKIDYRKNGSDIQFNVNGLGNFTFFDLTESTTNVKPGILENEKNEKTYSFEDDEVVITATAEEETGIPEDAELKAEKLQEKSGTYVSAMNEVKEFLNLNEKQELLYIPYDIYFQSKDGNRIEPETGKVNVKMTFKQSIFENHQNNTEFVAHIKNDGNVERIQNSSDEQNTVAFDVGSFSIMGPAMVTEKDQSIDVTVQDVVSPIIIDDLKVSFSSGASFKDGKYIWNPTDSAQGHMFMYRVDYTISGTFSPERGAFKLELPLHILKDRNGNWADTFDCPYQIDSEVADTENPDFVYQVDEENNRAIIYNYAPYVSGEAGFIEFYYATTKNTVYYKDMAASSKVTAKIYAKNESATVTEEAEAVPVYIDTHATITYTQNRTPGLYNTWNDSWGEKPEDSDDYLYLVWTIHSYINKNTSMYDFYLNDTFSDFGGSVVGYKFAGQSGFSEINHVDGLTSYGDRYDYVLTRHSKEEVKKVTGEGQDITYSVHNDIEAEVSPTDHIDADTTARSSLDWRYEQPKYSAPTGHFWSEKNGLYGRDYIVNSSENVTDYTLQEFCDGEEKQIDHIRYYTYGEGYPYPWTLGDEADGTVNDVLNGIYGQKKVNYELLDDRFYVEGTRLNDDDYNLTSINWTPIIRTATFNENSYSFTENQINTFDEADKIDIYVRKKTDWKQAAVYNPQTKKYEDVDATCVESASGSQVLFAEGVKGVKIICSNAYYHTRLNVYPDITLNRTNNVLSLIGNATKIKVKNESDFSVMQDGSTLLKRTTSGTDYIQKVVRTSEIKKNITQTKNMKRTGSFDVTWSISTQETYVDNDGVHYIPQQDGKFYDLLPAGSILNAASIAVSASEEKLRTGEYSYNVIENFKDSGQSLLTITINEPTNSNYYLTYQTSHPYSSINDYGKNLLNSVAYESGNEKIGNGLPDNGGGITKKDIMTDLDPDTDSNKFLYAEARYSINIPVAAATGLKKQVKNATDNQYSSETTTHIGENYSYQIRLANDAFTKSKDIVFFDSLENFYQKANEKSPTIPSDWKGSLIGVGTNNLSFKGIRPIVYLSKMNDMNIQNHHDLDEEQNGEPVWITYDEFVNQYGLEKATAIAVDAGIRSDGSDYIMAEKESISFEIYMKAPESDNSGTSDPIAYNNIYVDRTALREDGNDIYEIPQFYHQDYTKIHYRVAGTLKLKKVDNTDGITPIRGITYTLTGISDYGTEYNEERVSDKNGNMEFETIEKGSYEVRETACSDDWQLNTETYVVKIDEKGNAIIENLQKSGEMYIVSDNPRIHTDIIFVKYNSVTNGIVKNVKFRLSGTSDYGNDYLLYATSDENGRTDFENIELGIYELAEVEVPDGYIKKKEPWKIVIDEKSTAIIYNGDEEEKKNIAGYYMLANEPYHSIRFVKSSTYGDGIYLEGAEFSLTGISDYGTSVDKTAVSGKAEDGGLVVFDGLEPGVYVLKETKAPEEHDLDEKPYNVVIKSDGTFSIDGLKKIKFGKTESLLDILDSTDNQNLTIIREEFSHLYRW